MSEQRTTRLVFKLELIVPFCIMLAGTIICLTTNLDIELSNLFFDPEKESWQHNNTPFVSLSYHWGPVFSAIAAFWALLFFFLSYMHPRFWAKRVVSLFILLCIIIGPVIVVNGIVKETWKRPRPRDIIEFGGTHQFRKVLEFGDWNYRGKSFPGGHASAGFILVMLYFLWKNKRPRLAFAALLFSIGWGSWLSYVRIVLGGHFFSDNLYAFGLNWYIVMALYYKWYIPHLEKQKPLAPFKPSKQRYAVGGSLLFIGICLLLFRFLFSTPFRIDYPRETKALPYEVKAITIKVRAKKGDITIRRSKARRFEVQTWINGHALPDISAKRNLVIVPEKSRWTIEYSVEPQGFYYEYQSHTTVIVPEHIEVKWDLFTKQGAIFRKDLKNR